MGEPLPPQAALRAAVTRGGNFKAGYPFYVALFHSTHARVTRRNSFYFY